MLVTDVVSYGVTIMKIVAVRLKNMVATGIVLVSVVCLLFAGMVCNAIYGGTHKKLPIYRVRLEEGDNRIAITFDCAWGADDIPMILQILEEYNAKATFFVLGTWAEQNPEQMVAIAEAGHEIGNHSYSHKTPGKLDEAGLTEEITKCNEAIYGAIGREPKLYRAPSGDYNDLVIRTAENLGFPTIQWDVDSIDWKEEMGADDIYERIVTRTKAGSILLFHNDTAHTVEVLPSILQTLTEKGYQSVTVSELIYKEGYKIDATGEQQKIM